VNSVEKISIALSNDLLMRIRQAVGTGDYASTSEVIREALREWKARRPVEQGRARAPRVDDVAGSTENGNALYPLRPELRDQIASLCERHGVKQLGFFGSILRGDFDPKRSDVDVTVEFAQSPGLPSGKAYFDFKAELEQLLGRPVDLVELSGLPESRLRRVIARTAVAVYEQAA
jgi:predicted nucleotidyltransferase